MPSMAWFHSGADTFQSGELRLLGLPALLMEERGWTCSFRSEAEGGAPADVVVLSAYTLSAVALTTRWPRPPTVLVSLEDGAVGDVEQLHALRLATGRIDAVVARGPAAARWARDNLADRARIMVVPDIAAREPEQRAAALRFGVSRLPSAALAPGCDRVWFAAPGDMVSEEEVGLMLEAAQAALAAGERMVAVAPQPVLDWLHQAGLPPQVTTLPWSAGLLGQLLATPARLVLPEVAGVGRRQAMAIRHRGGHVPGLDVERYAPWSVAARWREAVEAVRAPAIPIRPEPRTLLVFLDLIQDLELALPILAAALARPGLRLRVAATTWLRDSNPRFASAMAALGIVPEFYERQAVQAGGAVPLAGVAALLTLVETTLNAHKRAHLLTLEAQAQDIPTFTLQHGLENVGLTYFDDQHDRSVDIRSDHILVWFPPDHVPAAVPPRVRPRLVHVGRPRMAEAAASPVRPRADTRLIAVFENLHWERYSPDFREQFVRDCFQLAAALEDTVVVIKPHPAGKWLTKSRDPGTEWPVNVLVADPEDPLWHDSTAASLIAVADAVITTPSTIAVDTALKGRRVAVAGYDLDVSAYAPLPILRSFNDWLGFAVSRDAGPRSALARARFLQRIDMAGPSEVRVLDAVESVLAGRLVAPAPSTDAPLMAQGGGR